MQKTMTKIYKKHCFCMKKPSKGIKKTMSKKVSKIIKKRSQNGTKSYPKTIKNQ